MAKLSKRGRKPTLAGRLASMGARGLRFGQVALDEYAAPPEHLGEFGRDAWALIVTELAEAKELSRGDVMLVEMTARAWERWALLDRAIVEIGKSGEGAEASDNEAEGADGEISLSGEGARLKQILAALGGEVSPKGYLSGLAQARAAAAKELRACLGDLGFGPMARIRSGGAKQPSFMNLLTPSDEPAARSGGVDAFQPNVVRPPAFGGAKG